MGKQASDWEEILVKDTAAKGLFSKMYKELFKTHHEENKQPELKMGQRS